MPADTSRPAAREQLQQLGKEHGLHVLQSNKENAVEVCKAGLKAVQEREVPANTIIFDTAGRLAIDEALMKELKKVKDAIEPDITLYVLDAMAGQDAVQTAKTFFDEVAFDGVIVTKLDGDARGGAMLSIASLLETPIYFMGLGEKITDFEVFHPDRMASRILGMGDVVSLVEKAQKVMDEAQAKKLAEKIRKNQFTIEDFAEQMRSVQKMGSMEDIMGMMPGGEKIKKAMAGGLPEKEINKTLAIISSMTPRERRNHQLMDGSRRKRIAGGSGTSVMEVNRFLKQFIQTKKMMSQFGKRGMPNMGSLLGGLK